MLPATHKRSLKAILLSPSSLVETTRGATTERLLQAVGSTGGVDLVIIFMLNEPVMSNIANKSVRRPLPWQAYAQLQAQVLMTAELRGLVILPVHSPSDLASTIRTHLAALTSPTPPLAPLRSVELIKHCTPVAPSQTLSEHAVNILSDSVPDLAALTRAAIDPEDQGRRTIETRFSGEGMSREQEALWEFFAEEWVVE